MSKNCDECIFCKCGFDSDGYPSVKKCHAKNVSDKEAIAMINRDTCSMYNEGHELYIKYKNRELTKITASQQYILDRKDFSKKPVAICGLRNGCWRGEGKYCYCRLGCTAKEELDGSGKMLKK